MTIEDTSLADVLGCVPAWRVISSSNIYSSSTSSNSAFQARKLRKQVISVIGMRECLVV